MTCRAGVIASMLIVFAVLSLLLNESAPPPAVHAPPEGAVFSYDAYAALLKTHVDAQGRVDYGALKKDAAKLDAFIAGLPGLDKDLYGAWSEAEQMAFWINAYNALTLDAILDHYPIKPAGLLSFRYPKNSIRQISGVWDKLTWVIMGEKRTLNAIEHEILRKKFSEPRIHMAIVCGSIGCPYLRNEVFSGAKLDEQLDAQTRKFLGDPEKFRIDRKAEKAYLSPILDWFGEDFISGYGTEAFGKRGKAERAVLHFISNYVGGEDQTYLRAGDYRVVWLDYDWSLNAQD